MNSSAINTEDIQYDDDDVCRERFGFSGEVVELAILISAKAIIKSDRRVVRAKKKKRKETATNEYGR